MRNDKENLIVKLTFEFALDIIAYSESIRNNNRFEMASQIFRCGTSIGANIKEAQNAESKADFIHKFKISAKEADELQYWLELCLHSDFYPNPSEELLKKLQSIHLIISKIISSSKKK
ncbi:four helix bundle protein [Flavobacterium sp. NRK F10]|uniref:four helix bundle protein n=1 Tax=Flavobacterium sp. NRK F10 TaxID=2954931 RepID=UPI0020919261|nr:four helix bundle protein [Flavobacterium sp. NRK F10]MCO6174829.1 four helix bundle protein [Flavobacterium sp. NRK F10]